MRPVRLSVRTPGFHPGKRGSIPLRATTHFPSIPKYFPSGLYQAQVFSPLGCNSSSGVWFIWSSELELELEAELRMKLNSVCIPGLAYLHDQAISFNTRTDGSNNGSNRKPSGQCQTLCCLAFPEGLFMPPLLAPKTVGHPPNICV